MKRSSIKPSERRAALSDGALCLEALAGVYDKERQPIWRRRARDARRHARTLRALR